MVPCRPSRDSRVGRVRNRVDDYGQGPGTRLAASLPVRSAVVTWRSGLAVTRVPGDFCKLRSSDVACKCLKLSGGTQRVEESRRENRRSACCTNADTDIDTQDASRCRKSVEKRKRVSECCPLTLVLLARPERFELPTAWFVAAKGNASN